jgi:hypothetical protein
VNIDPRLIDYVFPSHDGYPTHLAAEDTREALWDCCGDAARDFPDHLYVDPKDWDAVAAENDRLQTWPINYLDRFTNQANTHECTTHALRACFEGCRNRQRKIAVGPPVLNQPPALSAKAGSVWVSCLSIYSEANPRIRGGANVRQVMEIASRRGFLPDRTQPRAYGFQHSLTGTNGQGNATQSGGDWVSLAKFPAGWEETAKHFKPLEVIFPSSYEETVSLVLAGLFVGVGRNGHSIPYGRLVKDNGAWLMQYPDSYDLFRYDSMRTVKSTVGGSYAIATVTAPDDWNKPAG